MMDKGEMIERALGNLVGAFTESFPLDLNALAEQAIVIECEVEHEIIGMITRIKQTKVKHYDRLLWSDIGYHGTPGKAIAIIVSLEEG